MSNVLSELYEIVKSRKESLVEGSYTCYLFSKGEDKILKKIGEESAETIIAAKNNDKNELSNEICDLLYHMVVLCAEKDLDWSEVEKIMIDRTKKIGNLKEIKDVNRNT